MEIIPVIDVLDGCVVHAQRGERSRYRPIATPLCNSSQVLAIVEAMLGLYAFRQLYIADLDAIQHQGSNAAVILEIRKLYPQLDIWLDAGFRQAEELHAWQDAGVTCVVGSENLESASDLAEMVNSCDPIVLSLDFGAQGYMGPCELWDMQQMWPDKIVLMTLPSVGTGLGPDLQILENVMGAGGEGIGRFGIYAAGGVRHIADVELLARRGVAGVLVATALHNGGLTPVDIAALESG